MVGSDLQQARKRIGAAWGLGELTPDEMATLLGASSREYHRAENSEEGLGGLWERAMAHVEAFVRGAIKDEGLVEVAAAIRQARVAGRRKLVAVQRLAGMWLTRMHDNQGMSFDEIGAMLRDEHGEPLSGERVNVIYEHLT